MASFSLTVISPRTGLITPNLTTRNIVPAASLKHETVSLFPYFTTNRLLHNHRIFRPPLLSVSANLSPSRVEETTTSDEVLPTPIVIIDQESDPDATVVELSFGDRLGALLDTMQALKDLGLNVTKSTISVDGAIGRKRFSITDGDSGRKIDDTETLEAIRVTIIRNMLQFHPESKAFFAMGNALPAQLDLDINTNICITEEGPHQSMLHIKTADRPGLLREIVKILTDTNVTFQSGEFDTEGLVAKAKFHVKYRGAALKKPMQQALTNSIRYFLRRPETNEDSY